MWSTPISRHHFAMTRKLTPWVFCRVYVEWPARWRWSSTELSRAHVAIDWIAVYPIVRSIMTIVEPSSLASSARRYISSIVPAVTLR